MYLCGYFWVSYFRWLCTCISMRQEPFESMWMSKDEKENVLTLNLKVLNVSMLPKRQLFVRHYTKGVYLQPECQMTPCSERSECFWECCDQHIGLKEFTGWWMKSQHSTGSLLSDAVQVLVPLGYFLFTYVMIENDLPRQDYFCDVAVHSFY